MESGTYPTSCTNYSFEIATTKREGHVYKSISANKSQSERIFVTPNEFMDHQQ